MARISYSQRQKLDLLMCGVMLGSAMTFGLILLGYTVYRDTHGVNNYQRISSVPTRPQDIEEATDDLPNPPYIEYLEQAPPKA